MNLPTIKQLMHDKAEFVKYQDGNLWYRILYRIDVGRPHSFVYDAFEFPIPIDDAGGGVFLPEDKSITFMRWIRKHLDYLKQSIEAAQSGQEDGS